MKIKILVILGVLIFLLIVLIINLQIKKYERETIISSPGQAQEEIPAKQKPSSGALENQFSGEGQERPNVSEGGQLLN